MQMCNFENSKSKKETLYQNFPGKITNYQFSIKELYSQRNEKTGYRVKCPWDTHYQFSIKTLLSKRLSMGNTTLSALAGK